MVQDCCDGIVDLDGRMQQGSVSRSAFVQCSMVRQARISQ